MEYNNADVQLLTLKFFDKILTFEVSQCKLTLKSYHF